MVYQGILLGILASNVLAFQFQEPILTHHDDRQRPTFVMKHIYHNSANGHTHKRLDLDDAFFERLREGFLQPLTEDEDAELAMFDYEPFSHEFYTSADHQTTRRLAYRNPDFVETFIENSYYVQDVDLEWVDDDISIPNITDPETVLSLAQMSSNAYEKVPEDSDWRDVGDHYRLGDSFGWDSKGVRGHVFVEELLDDKYPPKVVISLKGTSSPGLVGLTDDGEGDTVESDKMNDNLLFSCCCARVSSMWSTVCDCYEGKSYTCDETCVEKEFRRPDRYYKAALEIYRNVTAEYPGSEVWMTGHSLGGALASLVGRTYGLPTVTFEAPPERLATQRLHLPLPPGFPAEYEHVWHFGNTADPIYMGVCNGASSTCNAAGYAMETQCHTGLLCTYDTAKEQGWYMSMLNHRIRKVIDGLLAVSNATAKCVTPPDCVDCFDWHFVDHSDERYGRPLEPTTSLDSPTSTPSTDPGHKKCLKRTWYGRCYKWEGDDDDDN